MPRSAFARLRGSIKSTLAALALALALAPSLAVAQAVPLQAGPTAPGRVPMYSGAGGLLGQPVIQDSGPASGGQPGLGLNELLLQERGLGTPPYANAGSGPLGTNFCDNDGPITGPYHFLCFGPNSQGGGMLAYGAVNGATPAPFTMNVNGYSYQFPFSLPVPTALSLISYGADPSGGAYSDAAFTAFIADLRAKGQPGFIPAGNYKFQNQLVIDYAAAPTNGLQIDCAGFYNTILHVEGVTASPQMILKVSGGTPTAPAAEFYGHLKGCSIHGNTAGTVLGVGQSNLSDALNEIDIDAEVANGNSTSATAATVQIGGVYNARLFFVANGGGSRTSGDACQILEMQFSRFEGSCGNAATAVHMTGGYTYGNTFLNPDLEEVKLGIVSDVGTVSRNTFIGGQCSYSVGCLNSTNGASNSAINMNDAPAHGASPNFVVSKIGFSITNGPYSQPESDQSVQVGTNTQYRNINVGGNLFQDSVTPDGTSYHTNYTIGKHDVNQVLGAGSAFDWFVQGSAALSLNTTAQFFVPLRPQTFTVANLTTNFPCNTANSDAIVVVIDAASATPGASLGSGGGTVRTPAYCNGTSWAVH